ncbi:hypothetical protein C8Q76DRAFT_740226 [Earliella scabrosa]|nr:hypothetical protein C8Q76DRAFT_740226 [Earliella scabrosa]
MSEQFTWPWDFNLGFDSYPTLSEPVVPSLTEFGFFYPLPWTDAYTGQQPEEPVPKPQSAAGLPPADTSIWDQETFDWVAALNLASPSGIDSSGATTPELMPSPYGGTPAYSDVLADPLLFPSLPLTPPVPPTPTPTPPMSTVRTGEKRKREADDSDADEEYDDADMGQDDDNRPDFVAQFVRGPYWNKKCRVLNEGEVWLHKIDWENHPPSWGNVPIPYMPPDDIVRYLNNKYKTDKGTHCRFDGCTEVYNSGGLKNHIQAHHVNLRTKCTRGCGYAARPDTFAGKTGHCTRGCKYAARPNTSAGKKARVRRCPAQVDGQVGEGTTEAPRKRRRRRRD